MNTLISFEVPGKPHAKERARVGKWGGYTPTKTVNAETFIRLYASQYFERPLIGPVAVDVLAVFAAPPSWSMVKVTKMLGSPHIQRPDLDNIGKSVCDGLNGVAYIDDCQIAEFNCIKRWGPAAKTVVTVRTLEDRN